MIAPVRGASTASFWPHVTSGASTAPSSLPATLPDHAWFSRNWLSRYIATEGVAAAKIEAGDRCSPSGTPVFSPAGHRVAARALGRA